MMQLYDSVLRDILGLLPQQPDHLYSGDPARAWPDSGASELVLLRESAYELGGGGKPAVCCTAATSDAALVPQDSVAVYGPELSELTADAPYARLALLRTGALGDDENAHKALQEMEFVKYNVFPRGFMLRTSAETHREQVRVAKSALAAGISFERVGCDYIAQYKKLPQVQAVRLLFVSAACVDFAALGRLALRVQQITRALDHVLENVDFNCASCGMKEICDEVEGMRELHRRTASH